MEDFDGFPKRRRRVKHEEIADDTPAVFTEAAEIASAEDDGVEVVEESVAVEPEEVKSRDIGNYKFTPWKGIDMWTNPFTGHKTFKEDEARRMRRQK